MRGQLQNIPGGHAGLRRKIGKIRELVYRAKRDPRFRQATLDLVRHVPERDWTGEIGAIVSFVRGSMRYTRDPYDEKGLELFVDPTVSLPQALAGYAAGDCDDHVLLASAMLETLGHPTRYRVGGLDRNKPAHIWIDVLHPEQGWQAIELTAKDEPVGWSPEANFPHTETHRGGAMRLNPHYAPGDLAGIGKYLKKARKYLPQAMQGVGMVAQLFPGVGTLVGAGLMVGGQLMSRGGGGGYGAAIQSVGSAFSQAWDYYNPPSAQILPPVYGPPAPSADNFGRKVQGYGDRLAKLFESFGLGWLPQEAMQTVPAAADWGQGVVALHKQLADEWIRLSRQGPIEDLWQTTTMEQTGVLDQYPSRPGFRDGGKAAFLKDWGPQNAKLKPFQMWGLMTWGLANWSQEKFPGPSGNEQHTHMSPRETAQWLQQAAAAMHHALWQKGLKVVAEKQQQQQQQQAQKQQQEQQARDREAQRKWELEQIERERKHKEELRRQQEEEARRQAAHQRELERQRQAGAPGPGPVPSGGPPIYVPTTPPIYGPLPSGEPIDQPPAPSGGGGFGWLAAAAAVLLFMGGKS